MSDHKLVRDIGEYLSTCVGILTIAHPVKTLIETQFSGMAEDISLNSRGLATATIFGGLAYLLNKGREHSRQHFNVLPTDPERRQQTHDMLYFATVDFVLNPLFYLAAGNRNLKEIALGTLGGIIFGFFAGGPMGYCTDAYKDLFGIQPTPRLPKFIQRQRPAVKKLIAATTLSTSLTLMWGVYQYKVHGYDQATHPTLHSQKPLSDLPQPIILSQPESKPLEERVQNK